MKKFEITSASYTLIHFDEYPILFVGYNYQEDIVIGSFICENDEERLLYFYSIVDRKLLMDFFNRRLSYLELLNHASKIHILTKDYNDTTLDVEEVDFWDIDESVLPLTTAYCPCLDETLIELFKRKPAIFSVEKTRIIRREKSTFGLWVAKSFARNDQVPKIQAGKLFVWHGKQLVETEENSEQSYSAPFRKNSKQLMNHV